LTTNIHTSRAYQHNELRRQTKVESQFADHY